MVRALNPGPAGDDQLAADLDDELDRLYGADLGDFVAERTRLVASLRKEGRRVEAARVKELRKPSVSAWAINQLVRRQRKDIDLLLDAGERLVASQRALLTGGGDQRAFEQARTNERTALNRLVQAAKAVLADRASASTLERLATTLRAAVVSEEARPDLGRGRLSSDVDLPGFEALAGLLPAPRPREARPQRAKVARAAQGEAERNLARRDAVIRAGTELKAAREREATVARKLREADRAERAARDQLQRAAEAAQRLRAEHQAAAAAAEAARAKVDAARRS